MLPTQNFCSSLLPKWALVSLTLKQLQSSRSWSSPCVTFSDLYLDTDLSSDPWAPDCCLGLHCCHSDPGPGTIIRMPGLLCCTQVTGYSPPSNFMYLINLCWLPPSLFPLLGLAACWTISNNSGCSSLFGYITTISYNDPAPSSLSLRLQW